MPDYDLRSTVSDAESSQHAKADNRSKGGKKKLKSSSKTDQRGGVSGRSNIKTPKVPLHKRLSLNFSVGRIARFLKSGRYSRRVGQGAPIFAAAVLDYLVSELVYIAIEKAHSMHKNRIKPKHIQLAIRDDPEFLRLLKGVVISEGGANSGILVELRRPSKSNTKASSKKTVTNNIASSQSTNHDEADQMSEGEGSGEEVSESENEDLQ